MPKLLEYFFAVCGALTLEGGPIFWVATHRLHHQHSDTDDDPHTPHHGGFWAHMGWILFGEGHHNDTELMSRYAPDLAADPFYRWLNTWHWVPLTVFGFAVLALGGWPMVLLAGLLPRDRRPARHVAGELGDAHVGRAPLRTRKTTRRTAGGSRC